MGEKHEVSKQYKESRRTGTGKMSDEGFSVSADLFINLKKGNVLDHYKIVQTVGEGAFG